MYLQELIEALEDLRDEYGEGAEHIEVRVAHQPNYPLMATVAEVTIVKSVELSHYRSNKEPYLFIACNDSTEYAPKAAWEGGVVADEDEEDEDDER